MNRKKNKLTDLLEISSTIGLLGSQYRAKGSPERVIPDPQQLGKLSWVPLHTTSHWRYCRTVPTVLSPPPPPRPAPPRPLGVRGTVKQVSHYSLSGSVVWWPAGWTGVTIHGSPMHEPSHMTVIEKRILPWRPWSWQHVCCCWRPLSEARWRRTGLLSWSCPPSFPWKTVPRPFSS